MRNIAFSFVLLFVFSCNTTGYKIFNMGPFSFTAPANWTIIDIKGIDSYIKEIDVEGDTLSFDYGLYSNNLEEKLPRIQPKKHINDLIKNGFDTTGWIFVDEERITMEVLKRYLKQTYDTVIIDGLKAKLVLPKQAGNGITGVYFDSVKTSSLGKKRLNLVGVNLDARKQEEVVKLIRSIDFHD